MQSGYALNISSSTAWIGIRGVLGENELKLLIESQLLQQFVGALPNRVVWRSTRLGLREMGNRKSGNQKDCDPLAIRLHIVSSHSP
jgi:hypothetical protein